MTGRSGAPYRLVVGVHPVRELLRSSQPVLEVHVAAGRHHGAAVAEIQQLAHDRGVAAPVGAMLPTDAEGLVHQGVVALAPPFPYADLDEVLDTARHRGGVPCLVALDGVTDPQNLGSIARTAEATGCAGLLVPARRSASVTPGAEKAAAGALAHLPVVRVTNLVRALRQLGQHGVWSVGLDADADVDVADVDLFTEPVVLVVGAEGRGLARLTRDACDLLCRLPLLGQVASLNASVAAGVALYEVVRRRAATSAASPGHGP